MKSYVLSVCFKVWRENPKFASGSYLVSCLSCCKMKLLFYSYPFDDERIKSLELSHGQFSLIITADSVRPCVSGCLLCPVGWQIRVGTEEEEWGGSSLFFPVAVVLCFEVNPPSLATLWFTVLSWKVPGSILLFLLDVGLWKLSQRVHLLGSQIKY